MRDAGLQQGANARAIPGQLQNALTTLGSADILRAASRTACCKTQVAVFFSAMFPCLKIAEVGMQQTATARAKFDFVE
jgi:hypothetical protein